MNDEIRFDVDVNFLWHGDTMEVVGTVANNLSGRIESEIAQHFEVDLSNLREYIRLKQEDGEIAAIVRCRDCKYHHKDSRGCEKDHDYTKWLPADFFCADGERRRQE